MIYMKLIEEWEENRDAVIHSYGQMFSMFRRVSKLEYSKSFDRLQKDLDILVMYVAREYDFNDTTSEWDIQQGTIIALHITELKHLEYEAFIKVTPIIDGIPSNDSVVHYILNDNKNTIHHCSPEFVFMNFIFYLQDNEVIDKNIFI